MNDSIFTVIGRATKQLVNERLSLNGGTLSGSLILNGSPTIGLGAATKGYVDNEVENISTDLGTLEELLGNALHSFGTANVHKPEYDAVASVGKVSIVGTSSPFPSTLILTSYSIPTEISYQLSEVSNDGTYTNVAISITKASQEAYDHLLSTGTITIGTDVITFI